MSTKECAGLTHEQKTGLGISFGAVGVALGFLIGSYYWTPTQLLVIAISAGALGGLGHEFVQSGGTISFYKVKEDGLYLGSLSGLVIGMISALILFSSVSASSKEVVLVQSLLVGLGFKGVAEAIGGKVISGPNELMSLENVKLDSAANVIQITVRNVGDIAFNISRIYVESQAFNQGNITIDPASFRDIVLGGITPPLVPGNNYSIRLVTTKGTLVEKTFKAT